MPTDHDLLVEVHTLMKHHLEDFRNHVVLDDQRDKRLMEVEKGYAKISVLCAAAIIGTQLAVKWLWP